MKKLLAVVLSAVAVLLNVHVVNQTQTANLRQTSVRLVMDGGMGMFGEPLLGFCSGTRIKENIVLTAAHCDPTFMPGVKITANGVPAKVVKKDVEKDLMLLYVEKSGPVAEVADESPIIGQKVVAVGFPAGIAQFITKGEVQGPDLIRDLVRSFSPEAWPRYLVTSAMVAGGNSGGGVFTRNLFGQYKLVGVVSRGGATINLSVCLDEIKEFLK